MRISGKRSVSSFVSVVLTVIWWLLFPVLAGVAVGIAVLAVSPGVGEGSLNVDAQFMRLTFPLVDGNQRPLIVGTLCLVLVELGAAQLIVYHLRKLFANIRADRPFATENSRHIRIVGLASIAGSVLVSLVCLAAGYFAMGEIRIPGVVVSPRLGSPMTGIFLGLVILVLAEVFRRGAELQEDHDLTV